jgi:hypothetical protein
MSETPYDPGLITRDIYGERRIVKGEIVALLNFTFEKRRLKLIEPLSRALLNKEIHELMITDEAGASPGSIVNRVSPLAFFEVERGGLVVVGDAVYIGGLELGELAGFDLTHMPNHMNVVVKAKSLVAPPIAVGDPIIFNISARAN